MFVHGMHGHIDLRHTWNRNANIGVGHFNGQGRLTLARMKTGRKKHAEGYGS